MASAELRRTLNLIGTLAARVDRGTVEAMVRDFTAGTYAQVAKRHLPDIHEKSPDVARCVAFAVISKALPQDERQRIARTHLGREISEEAAALGRKNAITAQGRKPWEPHEERTLEYLANEPDYQSTALQTREGAPNISLLTTTLNEMYHGGSQVRTKCAVWNKYFKLKKSVEKRLRERRDNDKLIEQVQRNGEINNPLEYKVIEYLAQQKTFQLGQNPNVAKLAEAVNYIFHENFTIRTEEYIQAALGVN